jgi:iron complex outermembrane receptor protein
MLSGRTFLAGLLTATLALPVSVVAQAAGGQNPTVLPPVQVVATRIPEATHEVSASLEVITGADLRARGATSIRDALSLAAGIAIAPGGDHGPAGAVPEFWGLREFDAFLLVVDGIPWGGALNPALASLSLRDVERIEVLRGAAPVTYGATSFVGVIHVVHSAAAAKARYVGAHFGSFGTGGAAADFMLRPMGAWNARASVDVDKQGFKDDRTSFTRGHTLLRTSKIDGDRTKWLTGDVTILRQDPASPHAREGAVLSTATPLDANYNPNGAYLNENRFVVAGGWERPVNNATWGTMASFTHSSQSAFRGFLTNIANAANNASGFKENIDINDIYVDSHLIWSKKAHVRFMTGADLLFANGEAKGATFNYTAPLAAATAPVVTEPSTLNLDSETRRIFFGAYGSAEWRPNTRLNVSAGLRLNSTSERRGEGATTTNTKASGSIGALFGVWESRENHVRVFANYRNTFKPAAFDFGLTENEGVLKPETSNSYESGVKVRTLDDRLDVEVSVFQMDFENLVTSTIVNNQPSLQNAGTTRFKGYEFASDVRLAHDVHARATYSFHDGRFVNFVQDFGGVNTQLGGKRFEMSARQLYSAGVSLSPNEGFIANANIDYAGDRYLNKRNTALVNGFLTADAGVGYRTARAEFRIDGRNLGNKRDPVSESEFGDAQYYRMTARTIQVGVAMKY